MGWETTRNAGLLVQRNRQPAGIQVGHRHSCRLASLEWIPFSMIAGCEGFGFPGELSDPTGAQARTLPLEWD